MKSVLVTGGAGFIGSFICEELLKHKYRVRVLDNLDPQVHQSGKPQYEFMNQVEFMPGDVTDPDIWRKATEGIDAVFHEASAVGVGQSQYEITHYCNVNVMGTATLLNFMANEKHGIKKLIVAASMSSYGEGRYVNSKGVIQRPPLRSPEDVERFGWEPRMPGLSEPLTPKPTEEEDVRVPNSVYAINKMTQEDLIHCFGRSYGIPTVALRYFNVFGPRQSLSNPYTGVLAIFTSRLKNQNPPVVYEDGKQTRDFIDVRDVAKANVQALESDKCNGESLNIGSGHPRKIAEVAEVLAKVLKVRIGPEVTGKFRKGDVRHCYASVEKARRLIGFSPQVDFEEGIAELSRWSERVQAVDRFDAAAKELSRRGLV